MWNKSSLRVLVLLAGVCATGFLAKPVSFGPGSASAQSGHLRVSLPQDWSHQHVVFSNTANMSNLLAIRQDPRLLHQWLKRNVRQVSAANAMNANANLAESAEVEAEDQDSPEVDSSEIVDAHGNARVRSKRHQERSGHVDWSVSLGGGSAHVPIYAYPAKFSFDIGAAPDCTNDFVVFPTFLSGTQASIVAYNNLYSTQPANSSATCKTSGPTVKWAYLAGGGIGSSPTLSLDGTKVAWVARSPARVHVLTIGTTGGNGTSVTLPATPGSGNNAVDRNFPLVNGGASATRSALYVDYADDVGYVGDDAGMLHKIIGVFFGTPVEVTTGGWPITLNAGAVLTAPVFDGGSKNIFVTDNAGHLLYAREVGSTVGICASGAPPCKGSTVLTVSSAGTPIQDGPIVDSDTGRVFTETANGNGTNSQIVQADTALGSVVRVSVGNADAAHPLHSGTFDNNYFNSVNTGFYYVCGKGNTAQARPTLYRIGFNAGGVLNNFFDPATVPLARNSAECSPLTEVFNTGATPQTEWLFVGVNNACSASGGINTCVMSFNITNGMPTVSPFYTAKVSEAGGTSGIVIDNVVNVATFPQASSIYFSTQAVATCGDTIGTGGCAVKLTQSLLQ